MDHNPRPENGCSVITIRLLQGEDDSQTRQQDVRISATGASKSDGSSVESAAGRPSVTASTSFCKTCFNGLNALSGVGILSVPYALASGGWLSLILFLIIACSAFYTGLLIQRCMDMDSGIQSYPDIGERAFGRTGRAIVSVLMNTELYLVATGFLILEGDNLHNLLPQVKFQVDSFTISGRECFVIIVSLIILPTVWLNNLGILSYISASGVVASFVLLGSIFWTGAFDGVGFDGEGAKVWNWNSIPTALSLYAFCYCAHPVFPTLYTSMRNRTQFSKVLAVCFFLCTVNYALIAVLGYLMFGANLQSQITLNLPIDKISSKVAIYTTLVNPIAKYALMVIPINNAIENRLYKYMKSPRVSLLIRSSLVFSTVIVALAIPFFGYLMSLVGAFLSISASILLPCLCFLKISGSYRRFGIELMVIACIMVMGVIIMIFGTYTSVVEIARNFIAAVSL